MQVFGGLPASSKGQKWAKFVAEDAITSESKFVSGGEAKKTLKNQNHVAGEFGVWGVKHVLDGETGFTMTLRLMLPVKEVQSLANSRPVEGR